MDVKAIIPIDTENHAWEVSYIWSDDYSTCTAKKSCIHNDQHVENYTETSFYENYQAIVTFDNPLFEQQQINLSDGTNMSYDELENAVAYMLNAGETRLYITGDLWMNESGTGVTTDRLSSVGAAIRTFKKSKNGSNAGVLALILSDATEVRQGFLNYYALRSVTLPKAVVIYGAFPDCSALKTVEAPEATTIDNGAFFNCTALETISLPKTTALGVSAFNGCSSLKSVSLPNATMLGLYAFARCSSLETLNLPKVTSIGKGSFTDCHALKSLTLGAPVTEIDSNAFYSSTYVAGVQLHFTLNCDLTIAKGQKILKSTMENGAYAEEGAADFTDIGENKEWAGYSWKSISFAE